MFRSLCSTKEKILRVGLLGWRRAEKWRLRGLRNNFMIAIRFIKAELNGNEMRVCRNDSMCCDSVTKADKLLLFPSLPLNRIELFSETLSHHLRLIRFWPSQKRHQWAPSRFLIAVWHHSHRPAFVESDFWRWPRERKKLLLRVARAITVQLSSMFFLLSTLPNRKFTKSAFNVFSDCYQPIACYSNGTPNWKWNSVSRSLDDSFEQFSSTRANFGVIA